MSNQIAKEVQYHELLEGIKLMIQSNNLLDLTKAALNHFQCSNLLHWKLKFQSNKLLD